MPLRAATRAAPIVPDVGTDAPTFSPALMPETTRSGRGFTPPPSAQSTESPGDPFTATAGKPLAVSDFDAPIDARPGVKRSPVPLSFCAGATTVTSTFATLRSAVTSTSMPGAFNAVVVRHQHPQPRRVRRRTRERGRKAEPE